MEKREIISWVKELICELLEYNENLQGEENLIELGMDSLKFVEMVLQIEEKYSIQIPDQQLNLLNLNCVNNIVKVIKELK